MKKLSNSDDGVSAVIGVILMVAITVILAVVIGAFVFGMGSSVKKDYVIPLTIDRGSDGNVYITDIGGRDVGKLDIGSPPGSVSAMSVTIYNAAVGGPGASIVSGDVKDLNEAGGTLVLSVPAPTVRVVVTATFLDGTQQVVSTADV